MLNASLVVLYVLFPFVAIAQEKIGRVTYRQYTNLAGDPSKGFDNLTPVVLYFNSGASVFYKGNTGHYSADTPAGDTKDLFLFDTELIRPTIYHNKDEERIVSMEKAWIESVILEDSVIGINWKILPEKRTISKIRCQKAEADVRGRHYVAWFTPDIPVSHGPWKLHGLPGLIIEAGDEEGRVLFAFESLVYPYEKRVDIEAPKALKKEKTLGYNQYIDRANFIISNMEKQDSLGPGEISSAVKINVTKIEIFKKR